MRSLFQHNALVSAQCMHYADSMSKSLQIRNLPDEIYQKLSLRAEREGRSLNQQAIVELQLRFQQEGTADRRRQVLEHIGRDLDEGRGRELSPPPEELIRQDRQR